MLAAPLGFCPGLAHEEDAFTGLLGKALQVDHSPIVQQTTDAEPLAPGSSVQFGSLHDDLVAGLMADLALARQLASGLKKAKDLALYKLGTP